MHNGNGRTTDHGLRTTNKFADSSASRIWLFRRRLVLADTNICGIQEGDKRLQLGFWV